MKRLIVFSILLMLFISSYSQRVEDNDELQDQIDNIYLRMDKHHKQFKLGTYLIGTGMFIGTLTTISLLNPDDPDVSKTIGIIGGISSYVFITAGCVIQIDSHKYFGREWKQKKKVTW